MYWPLAGVTGSGVTGASGVVWSGVCLRQIMITTFLSSVQTALISVELGAGKISHSMLRLSV